MYVPRDSHFRSKTFLRYVLINGIIWRFMASFNGSLRFWIQVIGMMNMYLVNESARVGNLISQKTQTLGMFRR